MKRGVLHGDLKPSNVIWPRRALRLFDFGLGPSPVKGFAQWIAQAQPATIAAWTPRLRLRLGTASNGEGLTQHRRRVRACRVHIVRLASGLHPIAVDGQASQNHAAGQELQRLPICPRTAGRPEPGTGL